MKQVTYRIGDPEVFSASNSFTLSITPALPTNECATVASHKKLLCMTLSKATSIRLLSRNGMKCDMKFDFPIRSLISTENVRSHPLLFYGLSEQHIVILEPNIQASGNINATSKYVSLKDDVFSAVPGEKNRVIILGKHNIYIVDETSGIILSSVPHQGNISSGAEIAFHEAAKLLAFPSKNSLTIFSLNSKKNLLSKPWEPHTSPTTFIRIFQHRKFSAEGCDDGVFILTASQNNSELRFWTFNTSTNRSALKEEVTIEGEDQKRMTTLDFDICVTPCEEYIALCSKTNNIAIIMELDRAEFKAGKLTSWRTPGPALCSCVQLSKVSVEKSDVRMMLFLTLRTSDGFYQLLIDEMKIASESSISSMDSAMNWFAPGEANGVPSINNYPQQRVLSVSSSVQGDSKAFTIAAETNAAAVVQDQMLYVTSELQKVKERVSSISVLIAGLGKSLQTIHFEQMADKLGKEFGDRNKGRLEVKVPPPGKPEEEADLTKGGKTEVQRIIAETLELYKNSIHDIVKENTGIIVTNYLQHALQGAVKEVGGSLCGYDATGSLQLYMSDSPLIKDVQPQINAVCADVAGVFKKLRLADSDSCATRASTNELLSSADQYIAKVTGSIMKVKEEVREMKNILSQIDTPVEEPIDPTAILLKCISLGESGDWAGALRAALHASDTSILLNFLESKPCKENVNAISQPSQIEMADFLSLCLQLSFEIEKVPGAIPSRLDYLHRFLSKWDDHLHETKKHARDDERCRAMLKLIRTEFTRVLESLEPIELKSLPRPSRANCQITRKMIAKLIG